MYMDIYRTSGIATTELSSARRPGPWVARQTMGWAYRSIPNASSLSAISRGEAIRTRKLHFLFACDNYSLPSHFSAYATLLPNHHSWDKVHGDGG